MKSSPSLLVLYLSIAVVMTGLFTLAHWQCAAVVPTPISVKAKQNAPCIIFVDELDAVGRSLGLTVSLSESDRHDFTKQELEAKLSVLFGRRVAEELVLGEDNVGTGAADDIRHVTELARRTVTEFGFNEKIGTVNYEKSNRVGALVPFATPQRTMSEETARTIYGESRRPVDEAKARARRFLSEHMRQFHSVADALLQHETLTGADIRPLLSGAAVVPFGPGLKTSA